MPQSSTLSLQKAIYSALIADTELTTLLNGPNIFDHVPQSQSLPFVVISQITTKEWPPNGQEHSITLTIWSEYPGRKQTMEISESIRAGLHDASLSLEDHHLINLHFLSSEARRDKQGKLYQMQSRFRAVTEPQ